MDRVHTYCMTEQISCTLTTMAMSAFVPYRFCVFFLYQTNKPVSYLIVIIPVETMQWFEVSSTNLIQFVNHLLWSMVTVTISSTCILAPVSMGQLSSYPSKVLHREMIHLLSTTRNIGWSVFTIYWKRLILLPNRIIYRVLPDN